MGVTWENSYYILNIGHHNGDISTIKVYNEDDLKYILDKYGEQVMSFLKVLIGSMEDEQYE